MMAPSSVAGHAPVLLTAPLTPAARKPLSALPHSTPSSRLLPDQHMVPSQQRSPSLGSRFWGAPALPMAHPAQQEGVKPWMHWLIGVSPH